MARARVTASACDFALIACHTRTGDSTADKDDKDDQGDKHIDLIADVRDVHDIHDIGDSFENDEDRSCGLLLPAIRTAPTSYTVA